MQSTAANRVRMAAADWVDGHGLVGETSGTSPTLREASTTGELSSRLATAETVVSTPELQALLSDTIDVSRWELVPRLLAISRHFRDRHRNKPHIVLWMEPRRTLIALVAGERVEREKEILDGPLALKSYIWKRCCQTVPSLATWLRIHSDQVSEENAFADFLANLRDGSGARVVGGARWMKPEFILPPQTVFEAFKRHRRSVDPNRTAEYVILAGWAAAAHWNLSEIVGQDRLDPISTDRSQAFQEVVRGMLSSDSQMPVPASGLDNLDQPQLHHDARSTAMEPRDSADSKPTAILGPPSPSIEDPARPDEETVRSDGHAATGLLRSGRRFRLLAALRRPKQLFILALGASAVCIMAWWLWFARVPPIGLPASEGEIRSIFTATDGKTVIAVSSFAQDYNVLHFYSAAGWREQSHTAVEAQPIAISPDATVVGTPGPRHVPVLLDIESGRVRREMGPQSEAHHGRITNLVFSQSGTMLFSGSDSGEIRQWETASGMHKQSLDMQGPIDALAVWSDQPRGRWI